MRVGFLFFLFLVQTALYGQTGPQLLLQNDSAYDLTAIVQGADGSLLGSIQLKPGEQRNLTELQRTNLKENYNASGSVTPYQVTWKCPHQGIYAFCPAVSPGSYITANQCAGAHYCSPKEKEATGKCICPSKEGEKP